VAAGRVDPATAWPDIFGTPKSDEDAFPEVGADMSDFTWEQPTAEQAADELEELMHGARVSLTGTGDEPVFAAPPSMPPEPEVALRPGVPVPASVDELEWSLPAGPSPTQPLQDSPRCALPAMPCHTEPGLSWPGPARP
jgi:hypothetical protein